MKMLRRRLFDALVLLGGPAMLLGIPALAHAATPVAVALPATDVTATSATLHGTVDPQGASTSYRFRYDNGLGIFHQFDTITRDAGSGVGPVPVQVQLGGLTPDTTFNVYVVAVSSDGEEFESDPVQFKTSGYRDIRSCRVPNLVGVRADKVYGKLLARDCEIGRVHKRRGTRCRTRLFLVSCDHAWVVAQKPKGGRSIRRGGKVALTLAPRRPSRHKHRRKRR
jgi:hypothetical protein